MNLNKEQQEQTILETVKSGPTRLPKGAATRKTKSGGVGVPKRNQAGAYLTARSLNEVGAEWGSRECQREQPALCIMEGRQESKAHAICTQLITWTNHARNALSNCVLGNIRQQVKNSACHLSTPRSAKRSRPVWNSRCKAFTDLQSISGCYNLL